MTILIIHPIYIIGTQYTSALDICFFNKNNLFNQYAIQTNLFLDTIELFKTYFLSKLSIQERHDNQRLLTLSIDYKQHSKNLIHIFLKIITAYQIEQIHIYNSQFFDILITELHISNQMHKLQKYANMITLFVNKYTWHDTFYGQYLLLTHDNKYKIPIEYSSMETDLISTISINYKPLSTVINKHVDINCNIYPFLTSIEDTWQQIITNLMTDLYEQVYPFQKELHLQVNLNIYLHLNTTYLLNLIYIADNINTQLPIDSIYLQKYPVDFNSMLYVLALLFIKIKHANPDIIYDYDCTINYFLV